MTETRPAPDPVAELELRMCTAGVRTSAVKIEAGARQILIDLAHGRLVRGAGRRLAAEVIALCEAEAILGEAQKAVVKARTATAKNRSAA